MDNAQNPIWTEHKVNQIYLIWYNKRELQQWNNNKTREMVDPYNRLLIPRRNLRIGRLEVTQIHKA